MNPIRYSIRPLPALLLAGVVVFALGAAGWLHTWQSERSRLLSVDPCILDEIQKHPDAAMPHYIRSILNQKAGNVQIARDELEKAVALEPDCEFAGGPQVVADMRKELGGT